MKLFQSWRLESSGEFWCFVSVNVVTRLWAGCSWFDTWQELGVFLFTTVSRLALGPTQPPIKWVLGILSLGVKWLLCEADHTLPSSTEVMNAQTYTSAPLICFHGMVPS
jgi:hypothetical protein